MADDDMPAPSRPKPMVEQYTHKTYAFRRIGKKYGRYLECWRCARACLRALRRALYRQDQGICGPADCLRRRHGRVFAATPNAPPPSLPKDFPEQSDFDEKEILPASDD